MGVYRNGVKQGLPYRNGVKMNAYRNGVKMFEDFKGFGMVVNSGSDSKFILPLRYGSGTAHHELTIDWGDGTKQKTTGNAGITAQYQGLTHYYPAENTDYEIWITGTTYLTTVEYVSYFGLGFVNSVSGYNIATNKAKVKRLLGSPDFLMSPSIPSKNYCYIQMFNACNNLTDLPANLLPETQLSNYCYMYMFYQCSGLTNIPEGLLPATTLGTNCYNYMFCDCRAITFIYMTPDWFTGKTAQGQMFNNCTNITANTPYASIPSGWK